jgi:lysophospholipase L1-like esterase
VAPSASSAVGGIVLVALGDSASTGHGDPSRRGWVQAYADLVTEGMGEPVTVRNLARDGTSSDRLAAMVATDAALRAQIRDADIVVIGIGGNDLNEGDAAMEAKSCKGTACYDGPAEAYERNLDAVAKEVSELHAGTPFVLRAIGMPNSLTGAEAVIPGFIRAIATEVGAYQAERFDDATCAVMQAHGGDCARLRTSFNGPDGAEDAYAKGLMNLEDCCYPSAAGHQLIAEVLYATGLAPIVPAAP